MKLSITDVLKCRKQILLKKKIELNMKSMALLVSYLFVSIIWTIL